jgi:hypothetical protein
MRAPLFPWRRYRGRIALIEQHKMLGHVINLP